MITTDRLILRPLEPRDAPAMTEFYLSERSRMTGGDGTRLKAFQMVTLMLGHWQLRGYGLWAVTLKGSDDIIGMVGPFYPDGWPETELGWVMFEGSEGKGYAFEAAKAALADVRERLGWRRVVHYIAPGNDRSVALAERLGAVLDPEAPQPKPEGGALIYRQPEGAA